MVGIPTPSHPFRGQRSQAAGLKREKEGHSRKPDDYIINYLHLSDVEVYFGEIVRFLYGIAFIDRRVSNAFLLIYITTNHHALPYVRRIRHDLQEDAEKIAWI